MFIISETDSIWKKKTKNKTQVIYPTNGAMKHVTYKKQDVPLKIPKELPQTLISGSERDWQKKKKKEKEYWLVGHDL